MSHTPGPWRFLMEEDGDEETGGYGVDCWNGDIIAGAGGVAYEDICQVWPRDEANGHLICAAPDLLAACETMLAAGESDNPFAHGLVLAAVEMIQAAVEKAKGEAA